MGQRPLFLCDEFGEALGTQRNMELTSIDYWRTFEADRDIVGSAFVWLDFTHISLATISMAECVTAGNGT